MRNPKPFNRREMREQIQRLNRLRADVADFDTIRMIISRMFAGVTTVIGTTSGVDQFFRCRLNPPARPIDISEIIAPKPEFVSGFQRCNAPHDPKFYCSSRRIGALRECRVKEGDVVYLSQWMGAGRLPLNKILDTSVTAELLDAASDAESTFYTYLDTIFTRRIHETFSNDYKFSAAIARHLSENYPQGDHEVGVDGWAGLRYPSVVDIENSYNIAFPSHFALTRLELQHLLELRVEQVLEDEILVTFLGAAADVEEGKICWTESARCVPMLSEREDKAALLRSNGKRWKVAMLEEFEEDQGKVLEVSSDDYLRALLRE